MGGKPWLDGQNGLTMNSNDFEEDGQDLPENVGQAYLDTVVALDSNTKPFQYFTDLKGLISS